MYNIQTEADELGFSENMVGNMFQNINASNYRIKTSV